MTNTEQSLDRPFEGRVAIVTGGAKRLGRAMALALAERGADLVVHYGRSDEAADEVLRDIEALGRRGILVSADLREAVSAARTICEAASDLGGADILINSAAIFENASLVETEEALYDDHLDINLKAPYFLSQAFCRQLGEGRDGQILNFVDWRAYRPPADYVAYTLSKAGLLAMTEGLAQQLAPQVRVNAIAPGAILPPPGGDRADWEAEKCPVIPLRRTGGPEDIVRAGLYLLTAPFVTGAVLTVAGGEDL